MIAIAEITEVQARNAVNQYLTAVLGPAYMAGRSMRRDDGRWSFVVLCRRDDILRAPAVGFIYVDASTGQIETLSDDRLHDMREAGAVQAAQACNELARDENGYVLRRHARIKANVWISDRVGLKVRTSGGAFIPLDPPVWRFSIGYHDFEPLAVIDVNAKTGEINPLTDAQLQAMREDMRAIKQLQTSATAT